MRTLETRIPPPVVMLLAAAGMGALAWLTPALTIAIPWRGPIVLVCAAAGVLVALMGAIAFRRARTTFSPLRPKNTSTIVRTGVYAHTRNPMYLCMLLALAAWALWLAHPLALLGLPAFVLYMNRFQIAPEERALSAKFGAAYEDYLRAVRRWF